jgi:hypothetical protein
LRYAADLLEADIPEPVLAESKYGAPSGPVEALMDGLVPRVLLPSLSDSPRERGDKAATLLFIRSHWLRMPPWLLARHLARKALKRVSGKPEGA